MPLPKVELQANLNAVRAGSPIHNQTIETYLLEQRFVLRTSDGRLTLTHKGRLALTSPDSEYQPMTTVMLDTKHSTPLPFELLFHPVDHPRPEPLICGGLGYSARVLMLKLPDRAEYRAFMVSDELAKNPQAVDDLARKWWNHGYPVERFPGAPWKEIPSI